MKVNNITITLKKFNSPKSKRIFGLILFLVIIYVTYAQFFISYSEAAPVTPTISSITPSTGPAAGGTPFTITGTNFQTNATVTFNGKQATNVLVLSSTTITGNTPEGYAGENLSGATTTQAQPVVVSNSDTSTTSNSSSINFTYSSNLNQILKSTNADFSLGSTSNVSSSGINLNSGSFQWIYFNESSTYTDCGYQSNGEGKGNVDCSGTGTVSISGGGVQDGGYRYQVTVLDANGQESTAGPTSECIIMSAASNKGVIQIGWKPVSGAYGYKIYRTSESDLTCYSINYGVQNHPYGLVGIITAASGLTSPSKNMITFDDIAKTTNENIKAPTLNTPNGNSNVTNSGLHLNKTTETTLTNNYNYLNFLSGTLTTSATSMNVKYSSLWNYLPTYPFYVYISGSEYVKVMGYNSGLGTYTIVRNCNISTLVCSGSGKTHADNDGITMASQNITVSSNTGFPSSGTFTISINSEYLTVTAGAGSNTWTVLRAQNQSAEQNFSTGDLVYYVNLSATAGPAAPWNIGNGSFALKRFDGKYLVNNGFGNTSDIYDPTTNGTGTPLVNGPSFPANTGTGANAIQRADGNYFIVNGGAQSSTSVYNEYETSDPTATTLSGSLTATSGTMTMNVASSTGYPAASNGSNQFFICVGASTNTCTGGTNAEEMLVTNVSGTTWTVIRGVNGFTAKTHANLAAVSSFQLMSGPALPATCTSGTFVIRPTSSLGYIFCGGSSAIYKYTADASSSSISTSSTVFPVTIANGAYATYISADNTYMITNQKVGVGGITPVSGGIALGIYKFDYTSDTLTSSVATGTTFDGTNYNSNKTGYGYGSIGLPSLNGSLQLIYGQSTTYSGTLDLVSASNASSASLSNGGQCNYNGTAFSGTALPACAQSNNYPGSQTNVYGVIFGNQYQPTTAIGYGSLAMQMPNGDYLLTFGNGSSGTNIFNTNSGLYYNNNLTMTTGSASNGGALALPESNGNYFVLAGGGTANTYNVNVGWNYGSSASGTYTSEAQARSDFTSWGSVSWQTGPEGGIQSSEGTSNNIEVATTDYSGTTCRAVPSATTLSSTTSNTITVGSSAGWPQSGNFYVEVDTGANMEQMLVTGGWGTTTWNVTRGVNGTSSVSHLSGVAVNPYIEISNGKSISGSTTPCLYEKATFTRTAGINSSTDIPTNIASDKRGVGVIQSGEQTYENRQYPMPTITSLTATYSSPTNTGISGTLCAAITTNSQSSICVTPNSGSSFPVASNGSNKFFVTIDSEQFLVTNTSGTTWTVTRGVNGTTAASSHTNGTTVTYNNTNTTSSTLSASTLGQYSVAPTAISTLTNNVTTYFDTSNSITCLNSSATQLYIMNTTNFPSTTGFYISIGSQASGYEIMQVTGISTSTIGGTTVGLYTVTRGQMGTTASAHFCDQLISFGGIPLYQYQVTHQSPIILSAPVFSSNATDKLLIEAEVKPLGTSFSGTPNYNGNSVNWTCSNTTIGCSQIANIYINNLSTGNYHWQVRIKNSYGKTSAWQSFGDTVGSDFSVIGSGSLLRGGTSISQNITSDASGASTTLSGNITAAQTNITVNSGATGFPSTGRFYINIGTEKIFVMEANGTSWTVIRGVNGTTLAAHNSGDSVTGSAQLTSLCLTISYCSPLATTTLSQAISSTSATTINISNTVGLPTSGNYFITINGEQMYVTGGQGSTTLTVVRAQNGTTAGTDSIGATVYVN